MEGKRTASEQPVVKRAFEVSRSEEQLWVMAYEGALPLLHQNARRPRVLPQSCPEPVAWAKGA